MIKINNINFSYGRETIFEDASFHTNIGNLTIITGESGCGKTTLLNILSLKYGVHFDFYYNDLNLKNIENRHQYLDKLYYMHQNPIFCNDLTLQQQWDILKKIYNNQGQLHDVIEKLGLHKVKKLYPSQLSGGERLRASLVNVFIIQPEIILLDEPTASLDDEYKLIFIDLLNKLKQKSHVIVSTHDLHFLDQADVIYEIIDYKLILTKQTQHKTDITSNSFKQKVNWFSSFLKMKKHHLFKEVLTCLFISVSIALCAFSANIDNGFLSIYEDNLKEKNNNIFVYKALDMRYPGYEYSGGSCFPINNQELHNIKNINHIKKMTPKIILSYYGGQTIGSLILPSFSITQNNKEIYNYQNTIDTLKSTTNNFSYYIESVEDSDIKKYISLNFDNKSNGIYLNQELIEKCGLEKTNLKGCSITLNIGIPKYDIAGDVSTSISPLDVSENYGQDEDLIPANSIFETKKEITLPINGILKTGLDHDLTVIAKSSMYMKTDYLYELIKSNIPSHGKTLYFKDIGEDSMIETKLKDEADLMKVYTPWCPNAYTIEVDDIRYVEEVVNELENQGYTVDWEYNAYKDYGESIRSTKKTMNIISISLLSFIILIYGIVHFIKGSDEKKLNKWLINIGYYQRNQLLMIKLKKYSLNTILIFILSYLILWFIILNALYIYNQPFIINMKSLLIIIIISIITQTIIPMLWEVTHHVKN